MTSESLLRHNSYYYSCIMFCLSIVSVWEKLVHNFLNSDCLSNHRRSASKRSQGNTFVCRFLTGIWFHKQRNDGANTTSIWVSPKKLSPLLWCSTKTCKRWFNGDIDFFDFVSGILKGVTIAQFLFLICLDYVLRTSILLIKENGFSLKKKKKKKKKKKHKADDIPLKLLLMKTKKTI